jgi:hypothetical protein
MDTDVAIKIVNLDERSINLVSALSWTSTVVDGLKSTVLLHRIA